MTNPTSCLAVLAFAVPVAAQWSTPLPETALNTASSEFDPCPTFDGMALYYSSNASGGWELYRATRSTRYGPFGAPVHIAELGGSSTDYGPCVLIDDCEIFFTSNRAGGAGSNDIWHATRSSPALPFNTPVPAPGLNTAAAESGPSLTADGLTIFFGRGNDIWMATRPAWTQPFTAAVPVPELNSTAAEREPHVGADGLVIFWTTARTGGTGANDTWMATRPARHLPFGNVRPVTELNATQSDTAPAVALAGDELFFTSDRTGGVGPYDIYTARFTGVIGSGVAGPSSVMALRWSAPAWPQRPYVAAASLGTSPGIAFGSRVLPLNPDGLLRVTAGGLPPLMTGFTGVLDADGLGSGQITFPGLSALLGLRFYTAFVVADPQSPWGLAVLSNAHEVLVQ